MKKLAIASLSLSALLAACGQPETITAGKPSDPDAAQVAAAAPVKLPPALLASKTYRCKDNSLAYVDFFNDGTSANIRSEKGGTPTALTAPAKGEAYAGGGYTVSGTAEAKTISITRPGKGAQDCDA
jgi:hypothetical protein